MIKKILLRLSFLCIAFGSLPVLAQVAKQTAVDPEALFRNPPTTVKPYVWWHWMGSNFSKEGITKDLEAMKAAGIGGATIFNLASAVQESHFPTLNNPWPEKTYRSPAYWDAIKHAAAEAERLGLEIGLHNTVGYSTTGGPWIDEARSMQHLVWTDTTVTGGKKVSLKLKDPVLIPDEGWGKTGRTFSLFKDVVVLAVPAAKKQIDQQEVLNLSAQFNPQKGLSWDAPAGQWIIYRICHASTGRPPHPVPDDVLGKVLEADKMSAEQSLHHWTSVLDPVKQQLAPYMGKSFKHMLIDSYEAEGQNWTTGFREEFMKRKGYDPIPWLASFCHTVGTGPESKDRRAIGSETQTARFDWDYRDVIDQLFYENGWNIGKKMLQQAGLELQFEPYGGPFNTPQGVALSDVPMAEFWTGGNSIANGDVVAAARAAGKTLVGAEAFTGRPETSQYVEDPAFLKPSADLNFAAGINRMILHHWVHQPFDNRYQPGMGMGWWGTHFGRNQTWFEPGKAFFAYLARCQALLQYGEQVAHYVCVGKREGYSDLISVADFLTGDIRVEQGNVLLPSGRKYLFIAFPGDGTMLPQVARKIRSLAAQGAVVVAPRPTHSPSLQNYPACDNELKQIGDEVWGNSTANTYQKGKIFTIIADALRSTAWRADYEIAKAANPAEVKIAHRQSAGTDIFFVYNQAGKPQQLEVSFAVTGKQPELWQAEDGSIAPAPVWHTKEGRTSVTLLLHAKQSVFVVFRKPVQQADHLVSATSLDSNYAWQIRSNQKGTPILWSDNPATVNLQYASGKQQVVKTQPGTPTPLTGPWKVAFVPKTDRPFELELPQLIDFSKHESKAVNYFAGTATYRKSIMLGASSFTKNQRIMLHLGELNDIAEVWVNGKQAGVLWYPPYKADITELLKTGENKLEIRVTNNWANRLIGDEQEPADFEWGKDRGEKMGRAMLAYPDWFLQNKPRSSQGRKTFSVWYYYRPNSPLKPAGLLGPVRLLPVAVVPL